jgi:chromatin segregation and condensation protein Rec8/ScpA/Scc1 (kleisin family)
MKKLALTIFLFGQIAFGQGVSQQELTAQLDNYEANYHRANDAAENLSRRADSLAKVIRKRKSDKSRNILSDRALAEELRLSQELAGKLQKAQHFEEVQLDSLIRKAEQTLKILNDEVTRLTIQFSAAKSAGNSAQQKNLAAELREMERLRQRCQTLLKNAPAPAPLMQVIVQPDDSPEQIAQKSDFMLDQADRLRRHAAQAEGKSKQLRQELTMRERLADFVQDLRVFEPAGETPRAAAGVAGQRSNTEPTSVDAARETIANLTPMLIANEQLWPQDPTRLSDTDLKKWVARLESQQRQWIAQADSLARQAQQIKKLINRQPEER